MTATPAASRSVPPLGGFNLTALRLEVRRVLRNRRTLLFVLVFPSMFFLMFSSSARRGVATPNRSSSPSRAAL